MSTMDDYTLITKCLVCENELKLVLDLGMQPLANDYKRYGETGKKYPLSLQKCIKCHHNQINCKVNPKVLFENYIYKSGTSNTGREYFKNFAESVTDDSVKRVLDIAANDGSQLNAFASNIITVGVDPAKNICQLVDKRHDIFCGFFDTVVTNTLKAKYNTFDVIIAQNVFAHIDYPKKFLELCSELMDDNSRLFIQVSQANMIQNKEMDTIYMEHLSFFNSSSIHTLVSCTKLNLVNIDVVDIHGGSYLFELSLDHTRNGNAKSVLDADISSGLYNDKTISEYTKTCQQFKNELKVKVKNIKDRGFTLIGFGSTAKSNTMLNYCELDNNIISVIIDENELKQGLFTPGTSIEIVGLKYLESLTNKHLIIVLAWNFYDEIYSKIRAINDSVEILNIKTL
jgi:hypothetical protein